MLRRAGLLAILMLPPPLIDGGVARAQGSAAGPLKPGAAAAQTVSRPAAPGAREVVCRGHSGGFATSQLPRPDAPGMVTVTLNFLHSRAGSGSDGSGLEPGTCAWTSGPMAAGDLHQIQFVTQASAQEKQQQHGSAVDRSATAAERYPDAQSIPAYLKNPAHFWRFTVTGQQYGWYLAGSHGAWKPGLKAQVADSPNRAPADGAQGCAPGYEWRLATLADRVCAPPESKVRVASENASAAMRQSAQGVCREGYVQRGAFPGDGTCVPPENRSLAARENGAAAGRRAQ